MRQTACEREECACTPVAAEARRATAAPMASSSCHAILSVERGACLSVEGEGGGGG
jgi:hypothetical protein